MFRVKNTEFAICQSVGDAGGLKCHRLMNELSKSLSVYIKNENFPNVTFGN